MCQALAVMGGPFLSVTIPEGKESHWWDVRAGADLAPSGSPTPPPNRWATEAPREEWLPRATWRRLLPQALRSRMSVLLLDSPVLKLIFISSLKQLSVNTPKTDHYPPKV